MIGSRERMSLSNGKLSFKEKTQMIRAVLLPAVLGYGKTFLKPGANPIQLKLTDFKIPDTAIVKEAITELEHTDSKAIINHSWRTYIWGLAMADSKKWQIDEESFAVASLMHDLGLVEHLEQYSCQCFTFESALRAENLCSKHHYPKEKTDNISEAICMHLNGYLNENDQNLSKEVILLQKATSCDVIGTDLSTFSTAFKDEVLAEYPRFNFNTEMRKLIKIEAQRNPKSRTALTLQVGLPLMIQMNIFKE